MRFIIIVLLFAIIAYAQCNVISDSFIFKPVPETEIDPLKQAFSIPIGDRKAACTIGWCIDVCLSVMSPPFTAQCSGNYCICRKL